MFKEQIEGLLKKELNREISLEIPPDSDLGDYAFPCFPLAKSMKKAPAEIAKELAEKFKADFLDKVEAHGPYVNFFVSKAKLASNILPQIFDEKEKYGSSDEGEGKVIVIEFPSPNTNKPLHLGHMRNMALGDSISRILENQGFKIKRTNLNNDRGVHICKSMLAYKNWGEDKTPESEDKKSDHLVGDFYVLFAQKAKDNPDLEKDALEMLKQWEAGDKDVVELWKLMNGWAFRGFAETYKHFGIKPFDKEYFESQIYESGKNMVLDGLGKSLFERREDQAIIVNLESEGLDEKVLIRPDGTSVYITQDLFLAQSKYDDYNYEKSIYVVGNEQNYHFQVLFSILKKLGKEYADKLYHFSYGMVHLPEGKMKSREGTVVDADNLMEDMEKLSTTAIEERHDNLDEMEITERSSKIGIGAIKFYLLKTDAVKDIIFKKEESISFEGDTGPYLQYSYARANSVLKKSMFEVSKDIDFSVLINDSEKRLITLLSKFQETVLQSANNYKPHVVAQYLIETARTFNEFYHKCPAISVQDEKLRAARLLLIHCTKQVIANGLDLLGISTLEEM